MKLKKREVSKSDIYSWTIIVLLAIYIEFRKCFLLTFSDWAIMLIYFVVVHIILLLVYLKKRSIDYDKVMAVSTIVLLIAWNMTYLCAYSNTGKHQPIITTVPLRGYITHGPNRVLFRYKGYKFDVPKNLKEVISKYDDDLLNKCELELSLEEVYPDVYYINYIHVIGKSEIDSSENMINNKTGYSCGNRVRKSDGTESGI